MTQSTPDGYPSILTHFRIKSFGLYWGLWLWVLEERGIKAISNKRKIDFFILVVFLIGIPLQSKKNTRYYSIAQSPFATSVINPIFLLALFIDRPILAAGKTIFIIRDEPFQSILRFRFGFCHGLFEGDVPLPCCPRDQQTSSIRHNYRRRSYLIHSP